MVRMGMDTPHSLGVGLSVQRNHDFNLAYHSIVTLIVLSFVGLFPKPINVVLGIRVQYKCSIWSWLQEILVISDGWSAHANVKPLIFIAFDQDSCVCIGPVCTCRDLPWLWKRMQSWDYSSRQNGRRKHHGVHKINDWEWSKDALLCVTPAQQITTQIYIIKSMPIIITQNWALHANFYFGVCYMLFQILNECTLNQCNERGTVPQWVVGKACSIWLIICTW